MNSKAIGEKLRALRGSKTIAEVAADLNISESSICMYESGQRTPRDNVKIKLAEYYGVRVETIFFDNKEQSKQMSKSLEIIIRNTETGEEIVHDRCDMIIASYNCEHDGKESIARICKHTTDDGRIFLGVLFAAEDQIHAIDTSLLKGLKDKNTVEEVN